MEKVGDPEPRLKEKNSISGFLKLMNFQRNYWKYLIQLEEWPNKVKTMQKNWIGKSFGCEIDF